MIRLLAKPQGKLQDRANRLIDNRRKYETEMNNKYQVMIASIQKKLTIVDLGR